MKNTSNKMKIIKSIPIGAGIKILALHNVKVYEITRDRNNENIRHNDREIPLISCSESKYFESENQCVFSGENPIIATKFNMTIKLELVEKHITHRIDYSFDEPIFKVL